MSQLRPYRTSSQFPDREHDRPPPVQAETDTDQPEYEVEKIVGHRKMTKGRAAGTMQYLVKWIGYPMYECTWEPLQHLGNAKSLLKNYQQMQRSADSSE